MAASNNAESSGTGSALPMIEQVRTLRNRIAIVSHPCRTHIAPISQAYRTHIASISHPYRKHIAPISQAYRKHIASISQSQAYRTHIASISHPYRTHIASISHPYRKHIAPISISTFLSSSGSSGFQSCEVKCSTCQNHKPKIDCIDVAGKLPSGKLRNPSWRCTACHTLKSRMQRLLLNNGTLRDRWSQVVDKSEFYKKNHEAMGSELTVLINEHVMHYEKAKSSNQFEAKGDWVDEEELKQRYKGKDAQLKALQANGRRFFCDIRQTTLWEDIKYTSKSLEEQEMGKEWQTKTTSDRKRKGEKPPGASVKQPKCLKGPPARKELSEQASKQLTKSRDKLQDIVVATEKLVTQGTQESYKAFVPDYALQEAKITAAQGKEVVAEMSIALSSNEAHLPTMRGKATKTTQEIMEAQGKLKFMVEAATTRQPKGST